MDDYGKDLQGITERMGFAEYVSVRGTGRGRFVFATQGRRAVELSQNDEGWWVEFWKEEEVVSDTIYATTGDAVVAAETWLTR
jgi:hypothetical protein